MSWIRVSPTLTETAMLAFVPRVLRAHDEINLPTALSHVDGRALLGHVPLGFLPLGLVVSSTLESGVDTAGPHMNSSRADEHSGQRCTREWSILSVVQPFGEGSSVLVSAVVGRRSHPQRWTSIVFVLTVPLSLAGRPADCAGRVRRRAPRRARPLRLAAHT
jgi:hypothetical protein